MKGEKEGRRRKEGWKGKVDGVKDEGMNSDGQ